jgi:hypothetical protein
VNHCRILLAPFNTDWLVGFSDGSTRPAAAGGCQECCSSSGARSPSAAVT